MTAAAVATVRTALPFARVGFLNMLAFRARYYVGVLTYLFNVAVYYFIWRAVFVHAPSVAGMRLGDMITYVAVGWTIRSFYFNEIDRDLATQVQEGRLAMNLIRPVNFQIVMVADAAGQSAFRATLFTVPIGIVLALVFRVPPLPVQPPRMSAERFRRLYELLRGAGLELSEAGAFEQRLAELRELYEPFVNALSRHFLLTLPPILADQPKADNWQTSAWTPRAPGIGGLPTAAAGEHFD